MDVMLLVINAGIIIACLLRLRMSAFIEACEVLWRRAGAAGMKNAESEG